MSRPAVACKRAGEVFESRAGRTADLVKRRAKVEGYNQEYDRKAPAAFRFSLY